MLETELMAPEFSLPDQTGTEVSLEDFKGSWVLLYFYPKDNTPGCTVEACGIRDSWAEFKKAGIVVLGVSADSVKKHQQFIADHQLPFSLLSDTERRVIRQYDALGIKSMFGKKYEGILRVSYLIDTEGRIKKVYPKVNPVTHAAEILKDKQSLGN